MLYYTTWLVSKLDPLKYICEKPYLSHRIARWQVLLVKYNIVFMTRKAIKGIAIADYLADHVLKDYETLNFHLLDKDVLIVRMTDESDRWTLYFDRAVNILGNGAE